MNPSYLHNATTVASAERDGRTFRLLEARNKSAVVTRTVVVSGGEHARRVEPTTYRDAQERTFAISAIVVRPEGALDRLGKRLGLNVEAQLGEPDFDDRYYIESDTPPEVIADLFSDPTLRQATRAALEHVEAIVIGHPAGSVAAVQHRAPLALDLGRLATLDALAAVAAALPSLDVVPAKGPLRLVLPQLLAFTGAPLFLGAGIAFTSTSNYLVAPIVAGPIVAGAILALVLIFTLLLRVYGGRSNGVVPWLAASLGALFIVPTAAVLFVNRANGPLDRERTRTFEVDVVSYSPPARKKNGLLFVRGLPTSLVPPDPHTAQAAQRVNARIMPHPGCKRLSLTIGPGRFENPWVAASSCVGE